MKANKPLTRGQQQHVAFFVETKRRERDQPFTAEEEARILNDMAAADPAVRARAVRTICPCKISYERFLRLRKAAKRLQKDPDPMVRANAFHVEEDARMVATFESQYERMQELEDDPRPEDKLRKKGARARQETSR